MNKQDDNKTDTQKQENNFLRDNISSLIGGVIILILEYKYFMSSNVILETGGKYFSQLEIILGYIFAGIFLFFVFTLLFSLIIMCINFKDGAELFGVSLICVVALGLLIGITAQLGLNSSQKSLIITDNVFNKMKHTTIGEKITNKLQKLESSQLSTDEIDIEKNAKILLGKDTNRFEIGRIVNLYFFNMGEVKTFFFNNGFQDTESLEKSHSIAFRADKMYVEYDYRLDESKLSKIIISSHNQEIANKLRTSIVTNKFIKHIFSDTSFDKFEYSYPIEVKNNDNTTIECELRATIEINNRVKALVDNEWVDVLNIEIIFKGSNQCNSEYENFIEAGKLKILTNQ